MDKITTGKIKKFFKGKGFAGALCLSVVAIGISTYLTYDSTLKTIADEEPQKPDSAVSAEQVDNTQSGIPKDETSKSEADSSAAPANNFVRSTAKRVMPIEGEVIWEYSNGELVKSETLGVWKTHDGMDIAASVGTDVKAACTGKVKEIKDDPLWGICVVIDHGDGCETHYCGLGKSLEVKEGSNVESGQKIGVTGTIECESKLAPHLHFAVKQNGKWVSPKEYING